MGDVYVESHKKSDDMRLLADIIRAAPADHHPDLFGAVYQTLDESLRREINSDLVTIAKADKMAEARVMTAARLDATEEHRAKRALERMREHDSRFDTYDDLKLFWDAAPIMPDVCAMTNGVSLLYQGFRNAVFGPSESGKTMLMLLATMQEVRAGRPVVYFDYETGPHAFTGLLRGFGATADDVGLVRYQWMSGPPPSPDKAREMAASLRAEGGRLLVIDTVTAAMSAMGLDPWKSSDVEGFYGAVLDPWAEAGCASTVVDHTPKDSPFSQYGSERKRSGISGMSVNVVPQESFSRYTPGCSNLYVNKDRHGSVAWVMDSGNRLVGQLHVTPGRVTTAGVGLLEVRPVNAEELGRLKAEADAARATEEAARDWVRRKDIHAWVAAHDVDGSGVFESHISQGDKKHAVVGVTGNMKKNAALVKAMLADEDDPLTKTADGKVVVRAEEAGA